MSTELGNEILTHFVNLTDPRTGNALQHPLPEMVTIALCAAIAGANSWTDVEDFGDAKYDWFAEFLELEYGIPSHDTFGRVFARLDTEEFMLCVYEWLVSMNESLEQQGIAIDGKTLRRSFDNATGKSALHLVSAWSTDLNISLGQIAVDGKSNEITAVPKLLELLELKGTVVTLDALHCQKHTAKSIRKQEADYVITVKRNQRDLFTQIDALFKSYGARDYRVKGLRKHTTEEQNHGRKELRRYYTIAVPDELVGLDDWQDLQTIGMVYRQRELHGKTSEEVSYFISSLPPKVRTLAKYVRGHWSIENTLHWSLDVNFTEDQSRIRKGNAPEIAAIFRRLAISIIKLDTTVKASQRRKRLQSGWNTDTLEQILTGFTGV